MPRVGPKIVIVAWRSIACLWSVVRVEGTDEREMEIGCGSEGDGGSGGGRATANKADRDPSKVDWTFH